MTSSISSTPEDMSDDSGENPFDFVAQYRKLEADRKKAKRKKEKKNEVLNNKQNVKQESKQKDERKPVYKDPVIAKIMSSVYTPNSSEVSSTVTSTVTSSGLVVNKRQCRRRKLNDSEVNSTVTSTASSSGSALNGPQDSRGLINASQTVNVPNVQKNTTTTQKRRRRQQYDLSSSRIIGPVISIGDFDDGYDVSFPISATVKITDEEVMFMPNDDFTFDELNRVMNIKVFWCKTRTHCFPLRMFQSIESIYEHFAKLEDIDKSHVSLKLYEKTLKPSDTPHAINYKITDFIDGEMEFYKSPYNTDDINNDEEKSEDEVKFHIKQKDVKQPMVMSINKTDKMLVLYIKLSEKLALDLKSFSLNFDGDKIKWNDTIESLDLEGDECFELHKKNNF